MLVWFDGEVGLISGGAGMTMATMDLIGDAGGRPACFLDCSNYPTPAGYRLAFELLEQARAVKGVTPAEALALLHADPDTRAIVYLGEIGGNDEYAVVSYASWPSVKPVAALIVGRQAPKGKKMGHAAALIGSHADTHLAKMKALLHAGVHATGTVTDLVAVVRAALLARP